MKKTLLTLSVAVVALVSAPALADGHGKKGHDKEAAYAEKADIVDTAVGNENFSTLVAAVQAAGLVDALKADGPYTVFAPVNDAFAALPAGTVEDLLKPENKDTLTSVLTFHVVAGKLKSKYIKMGTTEVETLNGDVLTVVKTEDGVTVNGANVVMADVKTKNGVIHAIDGVLLP